MTNTALIVVDIQNDYFSGGKWELNATDAAADNAARVIGAARERGDLVIHIRHETLAPNAPFFVPGSDGAQLHENVRNLGDELVIVKHFMNPYRETQLLEVLEHKCLHYREPDIDSEGDVPQPILPIWPLQITVQRCCHRVQNGESKTSEPAAVVQPR